MSGAIRNRLQILCGGGIEGASLHLSRARNGRHAMQCPRFLPSTVHDSSLAALRVGALALLVCAEALAADSPASVDHDAILQQFRNRVRTHFSQLRNYTCHVVVDRLVRRAGSNSFEHQDRVEFEAAFVGNRELFSRIGENRFEERPIGSMITDGMISNNAFGSYDDAMLSGDAAQFKYRGPCKKDGHSAFRYDFQVPQGKSQFLVRHNGDESIVGYEGTLWVDAETAELIRIDWKTEHIPSFVGLSSIEKKMHYETLHIGNSDFLLPANVELSAYSKHGDFSLNMVALKACREFTGESTVNYDLHQ